ncbi:MAG: PmoA family protein, partial [Anaerolineae bacterium]|nr:PmoA family protein [Anaerolineae bacterium]
GRIDHIEFNRIEIGGDHFLLNESLVWKPEGDTVWLRETRQMAVTEINRADSYWTLSFNTALHNVSGKSLAFGSPTTHGRPLAGYGRLFWRGPRSFTGGMVIGPEAREDYLGESLPWLAFCGTHDGFDEQSTLLFVDDPSNPRYPNKWFVRFNPYACVSFSFMFDETYDLAADDTLSLAYHIVIMDGLRDQAMLAEIAQRVK